MREQLQEIGRRRLERDLQRLGVDRLDAERRQLGFAGIDLLRVLDGVEYLGILRLGLGVLDAPEREHEIAGGDGIAVRPLGVRAQLEGIGDAVLARRPGLGDTGRHVALGVLHHQALEEIAQDVGLDRGRGLLRIEGLGLALIGDAQDFFRPGRRGSARERRNQGCKSESAAEAAECESGHHRPPCVVPARRAVLCRDDGAFSRGTQEAHRA